jgi:hypothetical protein
VALWVVVASLSGFWWLRMFHWRIAAAGRAWMYIFEDFLMLIECWRIGAATLLFVAIFAHATGGRRGRRPARLARALCAPALHADGLMVLLRCV